MASHPIDAIRNFSIVAHIDHGKSTLADRLIQTTGTAGAARHERADARLDGHRARARHHHQGPDRAPRTTRREDGQTYILNLMDTPGHVDFAYEVSPLARRLRGLAAGGGREPGRRGADARQRLPGARRRPRDRAGAQQDRPARRRARPRQASRSRTSSASTPPTPCRSRPRPGIGIDVVLEAIVTRLPPPKGDAAAPLKALLVDSWYDAYLGVVVLVRVIDGALQRPAHPDDGDRRPLRGRPDRRVPAQDDATSRRSAPARSASSPPRSRTSPTPASATRSPTSAARPPRPCPASSRCSRWCSAACSRSTPPISRTCAPPWAACASTTPASPIEMETSAALGFGFRCGFLGLLHLEIIQERLEREFNLDLIATAPSVVYTITLRDGTAIELHNPADMPDVMRSPRSRSRGSAPPSSRPTNTSARCSSCARTGAACRWT